MWDYMTEAALIAKADARRLEAAIAELPVPFRETLVLRDVQGLDYREIAEVTKVPIGTVMSRLARARRRAGPQPRRLVVEQRVVAHPRGIEGDREVPQQPPASTAPSSSRRSIQAA